jgi:Uma2 family endonuclease
MEAAMSAGAARGTYTPAEYLQLERAASYKSEYINGQIVAMTGASLEHNSITGDFFGELRQQLRGRPCRAFTNDMRVKVSETGLYTYPDIVVACRPLRLEDAHVDTLLNPVVIVEVLSPSTELYDRSEKFAHYRRLESLKEYILVAQDKVRVEQFVRQGDQWLLTEHSELDDVIRLDSIGCAVRLRDAYEGVELPAAGQAPASDDLPPAQS